MLKIVKDNQPSLRAKCREVELPLSEENEKLIHEMHEYLVKSQDDDYASKHHIRSGVGLAAPQVGKSLRMLVIYYEKEEGKYVSYALVNPKVYATSIRECYIGSGEGCLSVDKDHEGYVYRHFKIRLKAYDAFAKKEIDIVAKGYDAVVLQHELDHLDGILYYDHIDKDHPYLKKENAVEI